MTGLIIWCSISFRWWIKVTIVVDVAIEAITVQCSRWELSMNSLFTDVRYLVIDEQVGDVKIAGRGAWLLAKTFSERVQQ